MRVVITGGTGLVGSELARHLARDGHEVILLSRDPKRASGTVSRGENVRLVAWDAVSARGWAEYAEDSEAIVNLAGANLAGEGFLPGRWTDARKRLFLESRTKAGLAVLEAIRQVVRRPKVLVQASAAGYYGRTGASEVAEDHPPGDDFQAEVCAAWEASTAEAESLGVRRAVVRTGLVMSTQGGTLPRLLLPFRMFLGGRFGNGEQWWPWIHIEDHVRAIRFLIEEQRASGPFNLCAPHPVTNHQFARILGGVLRRPDAFPAPGWALRLAFGEVSGMLLEGWRLSPSRLQEHGFRFLYPELEDALRSMLGSVSPSSSTLS